MNHRQVLDRALRGLPPAKAAYLLRVAEMLERRDGLEERQHLLYPVLAAAAPQIEPLLDPAEVADVTVDLLLQQSEGIAAALYSPAYLRDSMTAMAPWAERLRAELAIRILDRLANGQLQVNEPKVWSFRSDAGGGTAFPFALEDEED